MIYIIISNIGLAAMTLILYFRYSHFRIGSGFKVAELEKRLNQLITEKEAISASLQNEVKSGTEQVRQLLNSVEAMRKEKEQEARLRLEAEKQIELAMQKTQEVQRRMDDWKKVQDAAMEDARSAILRAGGDLFEKISTTTKNENIESRVAIENSVKSVYGHLENISKNVEDFKQKSEMVSQKLDKAVEVATQAAASRSMSRAAEIGGVRGGAGGAFGASGASMGVRSGVGAAAQAAPVAAAAVVDPATKKIISSVVENIKLSAHEANKKYVAAETLSEDKLKFLLCDIVFVKDETLYLFDFKSMSYFAQYAKKSGDKAALEVLKQRLDKYIVYISNAKYKAAIIKLANELKMKFGSAKIAFVINSKVEMKILQEIKYLDNIRKLGIEVCDVDLVNDIVL